jgi:hypothetical protein
LHAADFSTAWDYWQFAKAMGVSIAYVDAAISCHVVAPAPDPQVSMYWRAVAQVAVLALLLMPVMYSACIA